MKTSFNKPEAYEKYYQILLRDAKFFTTLKDIFMLATVIGFKNNVRLSFYKNGGDPIKSHIFDQEDFNIMDIIAIETTHDLNILLSENQDEKYKMIEEYAHAGIKHIVDNIFIGEEIPSKDKFLEFVCQYAPENKTTRQVDVSTMFSNILSDLS